MSQVLGLLARSRDYLVVKLGVMRGVFVTFAALIGGNPMKKLARFFGDRRSVQPKMMFDSRPKGGIRCRRVNECYA